ncbi:MAG: Response regulator containing a CheY-like receiver domain and an DNA-binding domain [Frankiales bacterium]|nr:Response regulator containing a CheY-like receiver domain and an DNA-binding domain [Frankiales bacterium]
MAGIRSEAKAAAPHGNEDDSNIRALVRRSPLPVLLLELERARILEVSDSVETLLGARHEQLVHRDATELVADHEMARMRLQRLATGELDSYRVRSRTLHRLDGTEVEVDLCLRAVTDESPRRTAIAVLLPADGPPLFAGAAHRPGLLVLGTVDRDWHVDRISADVEQLLGYPASELVGRPISHLVQPEEWASLVITIAHALRGQAGASARLNMRQVDGTGRVCQALITPLAGTDNPGFAFSLAAAADAPPAVEERAWELENHLRRIAREIAATGLLADLRVTPPATSVPAMAGLSTRELEIVTGLLAGERVRMTAKRMFLSPSTVRNHLTSVYRKLGVGSQHELLALLNTNPHQA